MKTNLQQYFDLRKLFTRFVGNNFMYIATYKQLLEIPGCEVIAFREFGSYQGDWLAKVNFSGNIGWIRDYYGSCSYCDALLSAEINTEERQIEFAMAYLKDLLTLEQVLAVVSTNSSWDMSAQEMIDFVNENK